MANEDRLRLTVRQIDASTSIIGILGELTIDAETALLAAYDEACGPDTRAVILDFSGLTYMNSGGIGLLVTLMIRMQRQRQRLLAFGLSEHYRKILDMTRLEDVIGVHDSEAAALAAAHTPQTP
ncbi:MAG TPA: STAS domain-containing protein [Ktedonobacterales bacterium]|jgi:anti-sigma B factor antagonist